MEIRKRNYVRDKYKHSHRQRIENKNGFPAADFVLQNPFFSRKTAVSINSKTSKKAVTQNIFSTVP
ncbi:MAG TPA: hypothetical protein DEQ14_06715 [Treponema sp.]|nr:hypothetical protein [Treponema sp.]